MFNWFNKKPTIEDCRKKLEAIAADFEEAASKFLEYQAIYDFHPQWKKDQKEDFAKLLKCARLLYGQCFIILWALKQQEDGDMKELGATLLCFSHLGYKYGLHLKALHRMTVGILGIGKLPLTLEDISCPHPEIEKASDEEFDMFQEKFDKKYGTDK
jgi:hypothetical protein